jgi:hypothetical protein
MPKKVMVAYKDATATTAGITAWTPANTAMRKLCLNRTGWVIGHPLSHGQPCSRAAEFRQNQRTLSVKSHDPCVTYLHEC